MNKIDKHSLKLAKGAAINFTGFIGGRGLLFLYTIFLAKVLKISDLGFYFLGVTIVDILTVLANMGLVYGIVRYISIYRIQDNSSKLRGTIQIAYLISLLASITLIFIIFLAKTVIFNNSNLANILVILSLSIPFTALMRIANAVTRGFKIMKYTAYIENFIWIGFRVLLGVLFILVFNMGLNGALFAYISSSFLSCVVAICVATKFLPPKKGKLKYELRELLKFSIPMVLSSLTLRLNRQIDIIILGMLVPAYQIGIYGVAVRLMRFVQIISNSFQPIFEPFVSEFQSRKDLFALSDLFKTATKWNVIIITPIFLSLLYFPEFFLRIVGSSFVEASNCVRILSVAYFFISFLGLTNQIIYMSGRSDITFKNNIGMLLVNAILNYILVSYLGIMGAAISIGISLVLLNLLRLVEIYYLYHIHPFSKDLYKIISIGIISLPTLFIKNLFNMPIMLSICIFIMYILLTYYFFLDKEETYIRIYFQKKIKDLTARSCKSLGNK
ncbi:flippase [Desulfothermus naphthae]